MITENQIQSIFRRRGYVVVSTYLTYPIGKVLPQLNDDRPGKGIIDGPVVVIAKTDRADFIEQAKLLGHEPRLNDHVPNYYRVVAE